MSLCAGFAVVAGHTERLKVLKVERRTALVHGTNVVYDASRSVAALCKTAFAERLPSQLLGSQLPPRRRTVELRIGMSAAHLRSMLRLPRATACSFQCRHGQKMISELSAGRGPRSRSQRCVRCGHRDSARAVRGPRCRTWRSRPYRPPDRIVPCLPGDFQSRPPSTFRFHRCGSHTCGDRLPTDG